MFKRRYPKKFESLWVANYPYKSNFILPANRKVVWTVRPNIPDSDVFNCGVSHVAFNEGRNPLSSMDKSGLFLSNPNFIKVYSQVALGGKPLSQFTEAECNAVPTFYINGRGGAPDIVTTGASETNPSNAAWGQDFNGSHGNTAVPNQYIWLDRAWQQALGPNKIYAGDYDGIGTTSNKIAAGEIESFRSAYQSKEGAYNYMKTHTPFGNPFFTNDAYKDRHGLVKTYWDGFSDPRIRITGITTDLIFANDSLDYLGSNRVIVSFPFPGVTEFRNRQQFYKRRTGGDDALTYFFCQIDATINTIIGAISMIHTKVMYMWQDTIRPGLNPNLVNADVNSYNGSTPKANKVYYEYTTEQPGAGYPGYFDHGHNAMLTGIEMYCAAVGWASQNWTYCSSRPVGGNFNASNSEYIINTYQAKQPVGYLFQSGSRRALLAYNLNGEPGRQTTIEWNCGGEIVSLKMETGVLYLMLGEISN